MKIFPSKDVVVVEKVAAPKESAGGIVIPDKAQKQMNADKLSTVIAIGKDIEGSFKVGDKVVVSPFNSVVANIEGRNIGFCREDNILAVIK